jgi:hypothetical protein
LRAGPGWSLTGACRAGRGGDSQAPVPLGMVCFSRSAQTFPVSGHQPACRARFTASGCRSRSARRATIQWKAVCPAGRPAEGRRWPELICDFVGQYWIMWFQRANVSPVSTPSRRGYHARSKIRQPLRGVASGRKGTGSNAGDWLVFRRNRCLSPSAGPIVDIVRGPKGLVACPSGRGREWIKIPAASTVLCRTKK